METEISYICKQCNWQGFEKALDKDKVETCFGDDTIEICPECGSPNVFPQTKQSNG